MDMKRITAVAAVVLAGIAPAFSAGESFEKRVPLWPEGKIPAGDSSAVAAVEAEKRKAEILKRDPSAKDKNGRQLRSFFIDEPYYQFSRPSGAAKCGLVIVSPGGAYNFLASNHEGKQIVDWLNKNSIAAMMIMYRVPENPKGALQDIQRAIRIARANAEKWNIDPDKIAVIGFSAGANLSARASTMYAEKSYEPVDSSDSLSAKPDATILVYPAYCDARGNNSRWRKPQIQGDSYNEKYALADNLKIDKNTPPAFIIQSQDDRGYVNAAFAYYLALKDAGVPSCLHIFDSGGHGYGLSLGRKNKDGSKFLPSAWGSMAIDWLKSRGF